MFLVESILKFPKLYDKKYSDNTAENILFKDKTEN